MTFGRLVAVSAVLLSAACGAPPVMTAPAVSSAPPSSAMPLPSPPARSPASSVAPDPIAAPAEGALVYEADFSSGLDGWTGNEDWSASDGELRSAGQINDRTAGTVAPVNVDDLDGFAVEVEMKLLRYEITNGSFGLMVRLQEDGEGYGAGHDASDEEAVLSAQPRRGRPVLDARPFRPAADWHTYRLEVRGNELAAFIDGAPVLDGTDNTFTGGRVGLWSSGAQLAVRGFRVTRLL